MANLCCSSRAIMPLSPPAISEGFGEDALAPAFCMPLRLLDQPEYCFGCAPRM